MIINLLGRGLFYLAVAAGVVGMINLPIQITQLVLLTSLKFPNLHLPVEVPWYVTIAGCILVMLFAMLVAGIIIARLKILEHQNQVANENNPQIVDIINRLVRIEEKLK